MEEIRHIGIIGDGNVGSALKKGFTRVGLDVKAVGKDPHKVKEVADWADVVVLAVPFAERENAMDAMGNAADGKPLIDVTNAVTTDNEYAGDINESGAEQLQKDHPDVRVVKGFNTVFAQHMVDGKVGKLDEPLTLFAASDDKMARGAVLHLAGKMGFDPIDAGPLKNARWLEALGYFNIQLGYQLNHSTETGFRYVHPGGAAEQKEQERSSWEGIRAEKKDGYPDYEEEGTKMPRGDGLEKERRAPEQADAR